MLTTEIIFASNKLGEVTDAALQKMLDKFNLGKLISSERTAQGAMGQTMFITSTKNEFVLKGNPLYAGQFMEEKFFVDQIHKHTDVIVPRPYIVDDSDDIFGWSYSLMPRLQGEHLNSSKIKQTLNKSEKLHVAELIANTLLELHRWEVSKYGELDTTKLSIKPFSESFKDWLYNRIKFWLVDAEKYSEITSEDHVWVENLLDKAKDSFDSIASPTFVMGDFKPENFLLQSRVSGWEISGVFDFTNAYFGDGLSDLTKMLIIYMNQDELDIAKHLVSVYLEGTEQQEAVKQRMKVHMLQQCVFDWGCAKAMDEVTWDDKLSFSNWAQHYTESVASLVDECFNDW